MPLEMFRGSFWTWSSDTCVWQSVNGIENIQEIRSKFSFVVLSSNDVGWIEKDEMS